MVQIFRTILGLQQVGARHTRPLPGMAIKDDRHGNSLLGTKQPPVKVKG